MKKLILFAGLLIASLSMVSTSCSSNSNASDSTRVEQKTEGTEVSGADLEDQTVTDADSAANVPLEDMRTDSTKK